MKRSDAILILAVAAALFAVGGWMQWYASAKFNGARIIQLELPKDGEEFRGFMTSIDAGPAMRRLSDVDVLFMALYILLFAAYNILAPGHAAAKVASIGLILAVFPLDLIENHLLWRLARSGGGDTTTLLFFAVAKWLVFFVSAALLAAKVRDWRRSAIVLAAIAGATGAVASLQWVAAREVVPIATGLIAVLVLSHVIGALRTSSGSVPRRPAATHP